MSNIYSQIMDLIRDTQSISMKTVLHTEEGSVDDMERELVPMEPIQDPKGRVLAMVSYKNEDGIITVVEPVIPEERLIILGGGHVGLQVCEFAAKAGFRVTVCDDRPAFANDARFPSAERVLCDSFENCIAQLKITTYDYVVVVTRGHAHDADCLRAILPGKEPAYTGMIGSRRRVRALFDMLIEEGFSKDRIDRICSPIGLSIGANTPAEIAISILAELIAYKRLPEHALGRPCNASDLQLNMIDLLSTSHSPKAIVTVIETKGSTPRGAGAKMTVGPRGEITGSIGGGCAEGAIIRDAIDIIGTGRFQIADIDMTGDIAANDGMVCGGTMKVLIEDGSNL